MRHAFETALDQAEQGAAPEPPAPVQVRVAPDFAAPPGHHLLWEAAAAWTPEADPPPPPSPPQPSPPSRMPPPPPRPSDAPQDVARELGLRWLNTAAEVARARRRFMWDNHPDRRADIDGDLANRRVALANMLLDGALARLGKGAR